MERVPWIPKPQKRVAIERIVQKWPGKWNISFPVTPVRSGNVIVRCCIKLFFTYGMFYALYLAEALSEALTPYEALAPY